MKEVVKDNSSGYISTNKIWYMYIHRIIKRTETIICFSQSSQTTMIIVVMISIFVAIIANANVNVDYKYNAFALALNPRGNLQKV
jgi:hypothetical protein